MDPQNTTAWPPEKEAHQKIMQVIDYGKSFEWDEVCQWFGLDRQTAEVPRGWDFNQPWMKLRELLALEGFDLTERGMHGKGFRVLERAEMADAEKGRMIGESNKRLLASLKLSKVPREGLQESESKKLDHWEEKSALIGATYKTLLRKRNLPSPEMVIKSIQQMK